MEQVILFLVDHSLLEIGWNFVKKEKQMPNYKDTNNNLHFLDDASFAHLLPTGCVPITAEEAQSIRISQLPVVDPNEVAVAAAKSYLISTDYMMTADYDKNTDAVKILRSRARATIRSFINTDH